MLEPFDGRSRLYSFLHLLLAHQIPAFGYVKDKTWPQSTLFQNRWPPFWQIWIIFTHLKLWIASARHNFKWVKKLAVLKTVTCGNATGHLCSFEPAFSAPIPVIKWNRHTSLFANWSCANCYWCVIDSMFTKLNADKTAVWAAIVTR